MSTPKSGFSGPDYLPLTPARIPTPPHDAQAHCDPRPQLHQVGAMSTKSISIIPTYLSNPHAPIFRLPEEMLRNIFELCHTDDNSVTTMALVCKRWYDVIWYDQCLWRRILVSVDPMQQTLFYGSTFACATEGLVIKCLDRVGMTGIELTLVIGQISETSPTPAERKERFRRALSKMRQITFLCIVINPDTPLQDVIDSFSELFNPESCAGLPKLESLMIASAAPLPGLLAAFTELLETVNTTSPKLASLYLENVSKEFILGARMMAFWFDLRRITLKGEFLPLHLTTFDGCNSLEFLSFTGELLATGDDALPPRIVRRLISTPSSTAAEGGAVKSSNPTAAANDLNNQNNNVIVYTNDWRNRTIRLPKLQWLRLGAATMTGLERMELGELKYFVLQTALRDYSTPVHPPHSISFPKVEVFHVSTLHSTIRALALPKLVTLNLHIQALKRNDANNVLSTIFQGQEGMWTPKQLTINCPAHDKYILGALKLLPGLENLNLIVQDAPAKKFWEALIPKRPGRGRHASPPTTTSTNNANDSVMAVDAHTHTHTHAHTHTSATSESILSTAPAAPVEPKPVWSGNTLVPNLHSLGLNYSAFVKGNPDEIAKFVPKIEELKDARLHVKMPLERLSVVWEKSGTETFYLGMTMCPKCLALKKVSGGKA